jgi:hypothetical protein
MAEKVIATVMMIATNSATRFTVYPSVFLRSRLCKIALTGLLPFAAEMNGLSSAKLLIGKYS